MQNQSISNKTSFIRDKNVLKPFLDHDHKTVVWSTLRSFAGIVAMLARGVESTGLDTWKKRVAVASYYNTQGGGTTTLCLSTDIPNALT